MSARHVVLEGLIGAGKSRLAEALAEALNVPYYLEPVDENPVMKDFYTDMKAFSFEMEMWLLNARVRQHREIVACRRGGVQDRSIYADDVFARMLAANGLMTERQLRTYRDTFDSVTDGLRYPDVLVYLEASPATCLDRIHERNRSAEAGITLEYLASLEANYKDLLRDLGRRMPVIIVPWEEYGDVQRTADVILEEIKRTSEPVRVEAARFVK